MALDEKIGEFGCGTHTELRVYVPRKCRIACFQPGETPHPRHHATRKERIIACNSDSFDGLHRWCYSALFFSYQPPMKIRAISHFHQTLKSRNIDSFEFFIRKESSQSSSSPIYLILHINAIDNFNNYISQRLPKCAAPRAMAFHSSSPRDEEAKEVDPAPVDKGGLFGTGLSEWFALPIGMTAAVPIIKLEWYVVNEETQLAAVFVAFCVAVYSQAGSAIHDALDERAKTLLKEHNEAEDKVIGALEQKLDFLKANQNMVNDFEAINEIRENSYKQLNAAGAIKPQHDLKAQMERIINMVASEEATVTEKTKQAIMEEATAVVTEQFSTDKALKKAALDNAIAQIKGSAEAGAIDPVSAAFSKFLKGKAEAAAASVDDSEEVAQKAALIAKMSAVAKSEGMFFNFDTSGKPVMNA